MTMCGFFIVIEKVARTLKAHLGGPNTYQELLSPRYIINRTKSTASTSEVAFSAAPGTKPKLEDHCWHFLAQVVSVYMLLIAGLKLDLTK